MAVHDVTEYNEISNENEVEDEVATVTNEITHEECV